MKKNSKTIKCALSSVVEHLVYIERVGGSIPSARTNLKNRIPFGFLNFLLGIKSGCS